MGDEDSLLDCPMQVELGHSLCDHSSDAGIRCYGMFSYHLRCTPTRIMIVTCRY